MKKLQNEVIRERARRAGVPLWAVAHSVGVSEATLFRWLRLPLPADRENMLLETISKLEQEAG